MLLVADYFACFACFKIGFVRNRDLCLPINLHVSKCLIQALAASFQLVCLPVFAYPLVSKRD